MEETALYVLTGIQIVSAVGMIGQVLGGFYWLIKGE